ncbi:hypothetical protein PA10_00214 [Pseudomonas phage pPa_SNUABM_DT01]|nr:hypothetical protein PA10_00214 [Pseudomonas phage pPa_SNUABM_DT01]
MDDRIIVVGTDHGSAMEQLRKIADCERPLPAPAIVLAPGIELKQHQSLTTLCREAGYKVTDMIGGMGVIPDKKKERPVIKAMSLAELFKLK